MGSEAACYLLDTRFPVDTRKLENKEKKNNNPKHQNPTQPRLPNKQAEIFKAILLFLFILFLKLVGLVFGGFLFFFLMERLELRNAFAWKFGGFFAEKYVFGRRDVATPAEGRVNI